MEIREAFDADLSDVNLVENAAFGGDKEAELVRNLLSDPTASPLLSLLAYQDDKPVGHILFTSAPIANQGTNIASYLLAPLAVVPEYQKKGIGGKLIKRGLELLTAQGVDLIFVLGHPTYYPRHGFMPAGIRGFESPYPIPEEHSDAWMVQELCPGVIGSVEGKVTIATALDKEEYWRE